MTDRLVYRVPEVCKMLGIGRTTFYRWAEAGEIAVLKVGGMTLVSRDEIERLTGVRIRPHDATPGLARDVETRDGTDGTCRDSEHAA